MKSDLEQYKLNAEEMLDIAISSVADCLDMEMADEVVRSIRKEVIEEVVRLSKEAQDGRD